MLEPRVIRKYPNRRLYDTHESRYVALEDLRKLVVDNVDFIVVDRKSGADLTRSVLLQLIAEQEHDGRPMMSQDFLAQVIRAECGSMRTMVGGYLEQSLATFMSQHPRPLNGLDELSKRN